jgi:hypothetical protein
MSQNKAATADELELDDASDAVAPDGELSRLGRLNARMVATPSSPTRSVRGLVRRATPSRGGGTSSRSARIPGSGGSHGPVVGGPNGEGT